MIFIGDDWAEDHHDVCLMDEAGRGWGRGGCRRDWPASAGCMSWSRPTSRNPTRW